MSFVILVLIDLLLTYHTCLVEVKGSSQYLCWFYTTNSYPDLFKQTPSIGKSAALTCIFQLEEESVHNSPHMQDYRMDPVLIAMLEEFDKGYELLRKMEGGHRGIIIGMCQYAT